MGGTAAALLGLLLPERCLACGQGEALLCEECHAALLVLRGALCARCGCPTAWPVERCRECAGRRLAFASARAAVAYRGPAQALVGAWKERGVRRVADLAAELVVELVPRPPAAALTFVPGEDDRVGWRGVDTAESLAVALAKHWELPVLAVVARARRAERQRGLSRAGRRANVRGAFAVRALAAPPRTVCLVDDVYTTGATVAAVATELRRAGAHAVHVVTFARTVRR